ncbi:hypothetical protein [Dyadobacter fanqingshengii]|uniref:Uncharacterized protein n=1 Tax=Dyadobacter fanqingshengii TaxID=2906443 RepID=A0A9X1P4H5_9BACT|nr:hypothetical protein [Dyadobacter fanqingshengii]MCF0038671.1 hypothetical protein [Dyadobacter fanqingshengii]USJ34496.1 hypothetical protein NFI81_17495 [Dyadobacter fanqingshengii]
MKRSFNVKNKNKNIDKFFSGKLPDAEVPADEAWGKMNDMFNPKVPTGHSRNVFNTISSSALKLVCGITLLGLTVSGVVLFLNHDNAKSDFAKNKNAINSTKATPEIANKSDTPAYKDSLTNRTGNKEGSVREEKSIKEAFTNNEVFSNKQTVPNIDAPDHKEALSTEKAYVSKKATRSKQATGYSVESQEEKSKNRAAGTENAVSNANNTRQAALSSLLSLPFKAYVFNPDFSKKIKVNPKGEVNIVKNAPKEAVGNAFEVGLVWNVNAPFKRTDFLFNSIDSVRKPASLLIPGIWVTKSFREKHSLTLTMQARQPYFGNNKRLAQATDSIPGVDSAHWYRNTDLIKTVGFNVALQYHYQVVKGLSVGAGIGYSRTSGALMRVQMYNRNDKPLEGEYVSLKGPKELNPLLNTDIFYFKAGLAYKIGRFQTGINILAPISNISGSPQYSIREINGQFFLRFRVWQSEKP